MYPSTHAHIHPSISIHSPIYHPLSVLPCIHARVEPNQIADALDDTFCEELETVGWSVRLWLVGPLVVWSVRSFDGWLVGLSVGGMVGRAVGFFGWLVILLVFWLVGPSVGILVGWLLGWLAGR